LQRQSTDVINPRPSADFVPSLIAEALNASEKAACIDRNSVLRMQHSVGGECLVMTSSSSTITTVIAITIITNPMTTTPIAATASLIICSSGVRIEEVIVVQAMGPPVVLSQLRQ
jgi:hypothetical protein